MALSRDDFAAAFRALAAKVRTPGDVRAAFREQQSLLDRGQRRTMAELLGVPPGPHADLRSDPATLDTLGEILIEDEILSEPDLEKLVGSYLSRTYRKSLPPVPLPPALSAFDLEWEIGRGRAGAVYRARRPQAPHECAIKLFRPECRPDAERAKKSVELAEPGLVRTYEAGDGYLVMELVEGESIDALLAERKLSLRRGFELIEKAARVLAPLHARGLAHGSLAPGSILVSPSETVHLAEFGLASGTPADDVFALGAILYEMAAGVPPYEGFRARELRPPSRLNASAAGAPERIVCKAVARDLARRYPDAGALGEDLGRYLRHEEVKADVTPEAAGAPARKRIRVPVVVGVVVAAALVVLAILFSLPRTPPAQDGPPKADATPAPTPRPPDTAVSPEPTKKTAPGPPADPKTTEIVRKGPIGKQEEWDLRHAVQQAISAGHWDTLIRIGDEFILRGADRPDAYYWLALGHRGKDETDKALEAIDEAIKRDEDRLDYVHVRLPLLLARGEAGRALKDIERIYGTNTIETNARIRSLEQELRREGSSPALHIERGALYHYRRHYRQAANDFRAAVQAGDSKALYFYALALSKDDRAEEAIDALRRFIAAHSALPVADEARALLATWEHP